MIKIIYHANCSDGFCAAFLFWLTYKDKAEYIPFHYGVELELDNFNKEDIIYIVDFSFKRDTLLKLAEKVQNVTVLDHHKTAQQNLENYEWPENIEIYFDMKRSGAKMAWDYLRNIDEGEEGLPDFSDTPELVKYVQDRDLWEFKLENSKEVSAYLQALSFDFNIWYAIFETFSESLSEIIQMGKAILMKLDQQIDLAVKHAVPHTLQMPDGHIHTVPAVNSTVNFSEVAGKLAEQSGTFGIVWFRRSDGIYQYSLRSQPNFDVSYIAKQFGGGGHAQAAGFESKVLLLEPCSNLPRNMVGKYVYFKGERVKIIGYADRGNTLHHMNLPNCDYYFWAKYCDKEGYLYITNLEVESIKDG